MRAVVPACEDGGGAGDARDESRDVRASAMTARRLGARFARWAGNDETEGLWRLFGRREDLGPCAVVRYARAWVRKSSDARGEREARWDARASDMIEVARGREDEDGRRTPPTQRGVSGRGDGYLGHGVGARERWE